MGQSAHEPFKRSSSICHSSVGLLDVSYVGLKSQMLWRLISWLLTLEVGVPGVGYHSFSSERSPWFCVPSQLWVIALELGFMARLCLSLFYTLHCGFLIICLMWKHPSTSSGIFIRGNCFIYSHRCSVSLGGDECWGQENRNVMVLPVKAEFQSFHSKYSKLFLKMQSWCLKAKLFLRSSLAFSQNISFILL